MPGAILRSAFRRKGGAGDESAAHAKRLGQVSVNSDYAPALGAESREKKLVVTDNSDYLKKKRLEKKKKKENEKEKRRRQREPEAGHVGAAVESGKATRICCCLCVLGRPKVSEPAVLPETMTPEEPPEEPKRELKSPPSFHRLPSLDGVTMKVAMQGNLPSPLKDKIGGEFPGSTAATMDEETATKMEEIEGEGLSLEAEREELQGKIDDLSNQLKPLCDRVEEVHTLLQEKMQALDDLR